jgi:hypothetical protein
MRYNLQKEELNQYWYSAATVEALAREVAAETRAGARVAFLSTPSVYFAVQALADPAAPRHCVLFDVRSRCYVARGDASATE